MIIGTYYIHYNTVVVTTMISVELFNELRSLGYTVRFIF